MEAINPATEQVRKVKENPLKDIPSMVEKAKKAQQLWEAKTLEERIAIFQKLIPLIQKKKKFLAETMADDMGKTVKSSLNEIEMTCERLEFSCRKAIEWLSPEKASGGQIEFDPLGVVACISPWNFPFSTPLVAIAPALLAGNSVVFKPSSHSIFTGIEIGKLFQELEKQGLPQNTLQTLIGGSVHGKELVRQDVAVVFFTGSTDAGKDIMKASSEKLHKLLFELGGLDPAIVLKDADILSAAKKILERNTANTGQMCSAIKRVYVEEQIYDEFVRVIVEESKKITFGNPKESVDMGPLAAKFQVEKIQEILEDAKRKGAVALTGGKRPEGKGYFYPSTILTNVNEKMRILNEEPFGPLLPIIPVESWQEAVMRSNNTRYGLSASIWTKNTELGKKIAKHLDVAVVGINTHGSGPSGTPWGGTKQSGFGRMRTKEGMREFTNIKYIRIYS